MGSLIRGGWEVIGSASTASEGLLLLERLATHQGLSDAATANLLSPREREVVELLSRGLTGEQIAVDLVLSSETVKTHIRNAMTKLQATTRVHAIAIAMRLGYIGGPEPKVSPAATQEPPTSPAEALPELPSQAPLPA